MSKELMSLGEVRRRLGISRQRADQLSRRAGWPAPYARLSIGRVWLTKDIEDWIKRNRPALMQDKVAQEVKRPKPPPRSNPAE
jgi:prophage regulatory protein